MENSESVSNLIIDGFVPAFDELVAKYSVTTALVYGKIWLYSQTNKVCCISIDRLSQELNISYNTVLKHIKILEEGGYIKDDTPELKNRYHIYSVTNKLNIIYELNGSEL